MRVMWFALVAAVAGAFLSCSPADEEPLVSSDYTTWSRSTDVVLDYPIPGHLDNLRVIHVNEAGRRPDIREIDGRRTYAYPEGATFLKEVYEGATPASDAAPMVLTIMVKDGDHPDAIRGWVWLTKNPATGEETVITEQFCAACHSQANQSHPYGDGNPDNEHRDCVFIPYHPEEEAL